jgi:hypothetical protein
MVIIYNINTKEINRTEDNTMIPALPNGTLEEKKEVFKREGLDFVSIPYEMGKYIYKFKLCFDENNVFTGIQLK